jgi:hypothetical protein
MVKEIKQKLIELLLGEEMPKAMTTSEAIAIIESNGIIVTFLKGCWIVKLWDGCTNEMTRLDLITFAEDLQALQAHT